MYKITLFRAALALKQGGDLTQNSGTYWKLNFLFQRKNVCAFASSKHVA